MLKKPQNVLEFNVLQQMCIKQERLEVSLSYNIFYFSYKKRCFLTAFLLEFVSNKLHTSPVVAIKIKIKIFFD